MKISGHIDLCGPKLIEGWLHCDVADDEPIQLQVYVGDRLIGECTANIFRLDLQEAGYGNGRCGFSFAVPENFAIKQFSETRLRLIDSPVYVLPDEATVVASHLVVERVDS
jgi:hypothetical protein